MIEYKLTKSNRKSISIIIKRDSSVEVRAPMKMKQSEIEKFVISKQNWIDKNTAKMQELNIKLQLTEGSVLPIFGEDKKITYADVKKACIAEDKILIPQGNDIKTALLSLLKASAKEYIPKRTAELAEQMNISYSSVLINTAATHWGSCTADRLHFSCLIMLADFKTIDYVIIHELSHIIHHNHSSCFWNQVRTYCPDYLIYRQKLKNLSFAAEQLK